jgi:hypothetical protein
MKTKPFFKRLAALTALLALVILLSSAILAELEGLSFLDSFYLSMMTASTVGFSTENTAIVTDGGKVFISIFALVGFAVFFSLVTFAVVEWNNDVETVIK